MAYGISIRNDSNHILVSSDIRSFHYIGDAIRVSNTADGLTTFEGFGGTHLNGRCIYTYRIPAVNSQAPLVFIKPNGSTRYGIMRTYYSGGYWFMVILQMGGTVSYPSRVLCFSQLSGVTEPLSDTGLVTYLGNGEVAFDSSRRPMAIRDAVTAIPPSVPCDGGVPPNYSTGFRDKVQRNDYTCDNTYNAYDIIDGSLTDIAFTAPSFINAVYDHQNSGFKKSCGTYSCQEHKSWARWWCMYMQTYFLTGSGSTLKLNAGWSPLRAGYYYSESVEGGGMFGGDGSSYTSGEQPYGEATINYQSNVILTINANHYL